MTDLDLVAWLRSQLDWQEDVATRARDADKAADRLFAGHCSPTWTLREVDVKRKLVDLHEREHYCPDPSSTYYNYLSGWAEAKDHPQLCPVVRLLAVPFADRPGYQERWRP